MVKLNLINQRWWGVLMNLTEEEKAVREKGIKILIETACMHKLGKEETARRIKENYNLTRQEVERFMEKYWSN